MDEIQDVLDASTNAGVVRAISEVVGCPTTPTEARMDVIQNILIGAGVLL
jgi:hypothetical protein